MTGFSLYLHVILVHWFYIYMYLRNNNMYIRIIVLLQSWLISISQRQVAMMRLRRICFYSVYQTQCSWATISTYLIRFYFIFLCLKNGRNFNVVIVSFLPSDHRNDPDLLIFAVSCLSFFDANGIQLSFDFPVHFYILTCGIVLYCGTLLLWVSMYTIFLIEHTLLMYAY